MKIDLESMKARLAEGLDPREIAALIEEVERLREDFLLIRHYSGEHTAGLPVEARYKYLIVIIPTIVDHALGDMLSGGEEAYAAIVQDGGNQVVSVQEISRLTEEINGLQLDLERERRETFTPGSRVVYGRKRTVVLILAPIDDFYCRVRSSKGTEFGLAYSAIRGFAD